MSLLFLATHITLPAALWVLGIISVVLCWRSAQRLRSAIARRAWTCIELPSPDGAQTPFQRLGAWFGQYRVRRYKYALLSVSIAMLVSVLTVVCWFVIR